MLKVLLFFEVIDVIFIQLLVIHCKTWEDEGVLNPSDLLHR